MMKKRDVLLFSIPVLAAVLIAAFAVFLFRQIENFEKTYASGVRDGIALEARLVSAAIRPMLDSGDLAGAAAFCGRFDRDSLRVTLIDSSGKVAADSGAKPGFLGNHLDRSEVKSALAGTPADAMRFSESLNQWMMYYAVPIRTAKETYVLRAAVSTDRVSRLLDFFRLNMFWALLFGGEIVLLLGVYIATRVRKPLVSLQKSVNEIASGKLDARIAVPESGIVRDLASGVSEMTLQLKRRLAETIRERNEKDALFETMGEAVLLFSRDGTLLRHNKAAESIFEFKGGDRFDLARCQIPELVELAHLTLRSGEPFEKEFTLPRGGSARSFFIRGRVLDDPSGNRLLLTATELTNLHRLESFRSDFISNVSHEIKTPLTCILGAVEALGDHPSPDQSGRLLSMLKAQSERLNRLVHDILSLAALEKQQLEPDRGAFAPTALDAVLVNAVNLCSKHASDAGILLSVTENPPLSANADPGLLEQAVVNLVENAVKYSGSPRIEVSLARTQAGAAISVRDFGIGIAPEHTSRIFERFYRVDKSRSRELGGTGLGLAIVKHIAKLHGGSVSLETSPGKGCVFRMNLPL